MDPGHARRGVVELRLRQPRPRARRAAVRVRQPVRARLRRAADVAAWLPARPYQHADERAAAVRDGVGLQTQQRRPRRRADARAARPRRRRALPPRPALCVAAAVRVRRGYADAGAGQARLLAVQCAGHGLHALSVLRAATAAHGARPRLGHLARLHRSAPLLARGPAPRVFRAVCDSDAQRPRLPRRLLRRAAAVRAGRGVRARRRRRRRRRAVPKRRRRAPRFIHRALRTRLRRGGRRQLRPRLAARPRRGRTRAATAALDAAAPPAQPP
mmetsp:Transcript_11162/g.37197  ORF Transcript_11162/g.37197 Transcript_11162/m.37197 type:complete len:272 (-) Transcript_11162:67-882(-)